MDIRGHVCTVYLEDFVDKFNCRFIGEPLPQSVTRDNNEPTTATASTPETNTLVVVDVSSLEGQTGIRLTVSLSGARKVKTNLDFNEATDDEVAVASATCKSFAAQLTGWMLFMMPNQKCQSTEGTV